MADNSPWHGRRVLVTGCTGFLGSAVTRELTDRGAEVVGLVRDRTRGAELVHRCPPGRFRPIPGRIKDAGRLHAAMAVHEVSAVFHLVPGDPSGTDRGTAAVLRAAGLYHPRMPVVTARPAAQLRLAAESADGSPVPLGIARFGEFFGEGDRNAYRVVPRTVLALLAGQPVPRFDGPARDFVPVRDAARACLALAEAVGVGGRATDVTFRSGCDLTEAAMASLVAAVFAGRTPEIAAEPPGNPLGWQPGDVGDALKQTVAWYRESGTALAAPQPARRAA